MVLAVSGQNQCLRTDAAQSDPGGPNYLELHESRLELSFEQLTLKSKVNLGLRFDDSSADVLVEGTLMWSLRRFEKRNWQV